MGRGKRVGVLGGVVRGLYEGTSLRGRPERVVGSPKTEIRMFQHLEDLHSAKEESVAHWILGGKK